MESFINDKGVLHIKQGGFYYNVVGNDALILNKYLGYTLYGIKNHRTGFPVSGQDSVLKKLDELSVNYDVLNQQGQLIASKRFENNCYEIINPLEYPLPIPKKRRIIKTSKENAFVNVPKQELYQNKIKFFTMLLNGLKNDINIITGEVVSGIDGEMKLHFLDLIEFIKNK